MSSPFASAYAAARAQGSRDGARGFTAAADEARSAAESAPLPCARGPGIPPRTIGGSMLATLAMILALAAPPPQELPPTRVQGEATTVLAQFTPGERYRFDLGGEAGEYSEWERSGLAHFDGIATTIRVKAVKGRR